jgi:hypothetical protein
MDNKTLLYNDWHQVDTQLLDEQPSQPKLSIYPVNEALKLHRTRSFQQSWYKKYDWLEYNVQKDAAFCFCCRKYSKTGNSSPFVMTGFRNWGNAMESGKGYGKHESNHTSLATMHGIERK